MNGKRDAARRELARLGDEGSSGSQDLTRGLERAAHELDKAIRKALGRFSGR